MLVSDLISNLFADECYLQEISAREKGREQKIQSLCKDAEKPINEPAMKGGPGNSSTACQNCSRAIHNTDADAHETLLRKIDIMMKEQQATLCREINAVRQEVKALVAQGLESPVQGPKSVEHPQVQAEFVFEAVNTALQAVKQAQDEEYSYKSTNHQTCKSQENLLSGMTSGLESATR